MTGFSPRLELPQSQTLIMTPQLQQSIKGLRHGNGRGIEGRNGLIGSHAAALSG